MKKLNISEKNERRTEPLTRDTMSLTDKDNPMNAMKMILMKMPIR